MTLKLQTLCFPFFFSCHSLIRLEFTFLNGFSKSSQNNTLKKPTLIPSNQRIAAVFYAVFRSRRRSETLVWLPCISARLFFLGGLAALRVWFRRTESLTSLSVWLRASRQPSFWWAGGFGGFKVFSGHFRFVPGKEGENHSVWLALFVFKQVGKKEKHQLEMISVGLQEFGPKKRHPPEMKNKIPQQKLELDIFTKWMDFLGANNKNFEKNLQLPESDFQLFTDPAESCFFSVDFVGGFLFPSQKSIDPGKKKIIDSKVVDWKKGLCVQKFPGRYRSSFKVIDFTTHDSDLERFP